MPRILLLALTLVFMAGCKPTPPQNTAEIEWEKNMPEHYKKELEEMKVEFSKLKPVMDSLSPKAELHLYEGLPHQMFEHNLLQTELKTKSHFEIGGFAFYREPLDVPPGKLTSIFETLRNHSLYQFYRGEKMCGGFHPDYCLEIKEPDKTTYIQACFGCHEMRLIQNDKEWKYEMGQTRKTLEIQLESYRKNRPVKPT